MSPHAPLGQLIQSFFLDHPITVHTALLAVVICQTVQRSLL